MKSLFTLKREAGDMPADGSPGTAGPAPWELLAHPLDPRERLTAYLNAWADMDESVWQEANVIALYEDIMDLFKSHSEAEVWFRDWRKTHPGSRLA